jgi:hypothetical protein
MVVVSKGETKESTVRGGVLVVIELGVVVVVVALVLFVAVIVVVVLAAVLVAAIVLVGMMVRWKHRRNCR